MTRIAFIGLGNMGSGMCANLCRAGFEVGAYDLVPEALERAVQAGAQAAGSAADAAAGTDVVISMLPAGEHVLDLYFGAGGVGRGVGGESCNRQSSGDQSNSGFHQESSFRSAWCA